VTAPSLSSLDSTVAASAMQCETCDRAAPWRGFAAAYEAAWGSAVREMREGEIAGAWAVKGTTMRRVWTCPECRAPEATAPAPERAPLAVPLAVPLAFVDRVRRGVREGITKADTHGGGIDPDLGRTIGALLVTDAELFDAYVRAAALVAADELVRMGGFARGPQRRAALAWWSYARRARIHLPKPVR